MTSALPLLVCTLLVAGPVYGAKTRSAWQAEWKKTVEAAKREGQVTIYTQGSKDTKKGSAVDL